MEPSDIEPLRPTRPVRQHPGERIRTERDRQGISVRELARRIGLTPSHLSKIERGVANPSVGTLWMILDELGIPVGELFTAPSTARPGEKTSEPALASSPPREALTTTQVFNPAVDPSHRESIRMAGVEFQRLTPHDDAAIEFMEVRHEIGAGDAEAYHHRGREYGLVLQGQLLVEVGFGRHLLGPGWSIAFDSSNPHRLLNTGDEPAVAVWVVIGRNQP